MSDVIESLIVDRTSDDAARANEAKEKIIRGTATAQEISVWLANPLTGEYNSSDLNRVSAAMHYLSARFRDYGYTSSVHSRTDWAVVDVPTLSDMDIYLDDLRRLRAVFAVLQATPPVPEDMEALWWHEANDIEQILVDVNTVIERVLGSFKRSGSFTFWSGYHPLPSAESDLGRTVEDIDSLGLTVDDLDAHGTEFYILSYGVIK